jgi:hypothetical protein
MNPNSNLFANLEPWEETGLDYSNPATPFVDQFAEFCVHFASGHPLGAGRIGLRGNPFLYGFVEPLARCEIRFPDEPWLPVRRGRLDSFPWCAVETASMAGLRMEGCHVFAGGARLVNRFRIHHTGDAPTSFDLRWTGKLPTHHAVPVEFLAPFPGLEPEQFATWLMENGGGVQGGWKSLLPASDYPRASFRLAAAGWTAEPQIFSLSVGEPSPGFAAARGATAGFALQHCGKVLLEPGESKEFILAFDLAWELPGEEGIRFSENQNPPFEDLLQNAREKFSQNRGPSSAVAALSPGLAAHHWRARHALLRTGYQSPRGEFDGRIACCCTSDDQFFSTTFFWDSLFSSSALAAFHPEFAKGAIHTAFVRQDARDGSCPENKWNYTVPQRHIRQYPQAPVGSWAVAHYLHQNPTDNQFLRDIYPTLRKNHEFWANYSDADADGLAEWRWSGQTADNSPLYDAVTPGGVLRGCQWLPPIASVHLNCFLYRDADILKDFAEQLGETADAAYFTSRKEALFDALSRICLVEKERRFWDFNHATGTHTKVKTFYMFWPLFARLPLPQDWVKELIETELLHPAKFFGTIPFPSVAYDEPSYDPTGYWRGKAWPHISYWLIETLAHYGYRDSACEAADKILHWYAGQPGFLENMETDPRLATATGHVDYNWGTAAFSLLTEKRFLDFTA